MRRAPPIEDQSAGCHRPVRDDVPVISGKEGCQEVHQACKTSVWAAGPPGALANWSIFCAATMQVHESKAVVEKKAHKLGE